MALTTEQIAVKTEELKAFIAEHKDMPGPLMPTMQFCQESFGYLSLENMIIISEGLGIPVTEVYGVATFYAQFSLTPKGDNIISVCQGTACYVKGGAQVLARVEKELGITSNETTEDGKFTIQDTRCLGCCGLAPVMTINEDVYGKLTADMIPDILAKY